MKKLFVSLCVAGLIVSSVSPLFAGSIDHLSNFSAEYMRTLNRNAATDSADAVVYNPAGVMEMENGTYGNLSIQYTDKDWKNKVDGESLSQDDPSIIPSLFGLYKKDRWAAFAAFTIPSGGGKVDYKDGNAMTRIGGWGIINNINGLAGAVLYDTIKNERLEAERYYLGFTLGGAYKINDMVSVSLGTRYIDAYGELKFKLQVQPSALGAAVGQVDRTAASELERNADGWCGIIGLNVAPTEELNIGLKYETRTRLNFKYDVKYDIVTGSPSGLVAQEGITDGIKERRDLPAVFSLGVSYRFTPKIRIETDFTYYFNEDADWNGDEDDVDNGYELGMAVEYTFNKKLKASLGYLYSDTGSDAKYMTSYKPELNSNSICGGIAYEAVPGLILNFALENSFYRDDSYVDTSS
ncbi:outer membrane protein transport protein, partial [bacterium]|nr:outer membrane protein transport protein [bacterium]